MSVAQIDRPLAFQRKRVFSLLQTLAKSSGMDEKIAHLNALDEVDCHLFFLEELLPMEEYVVKASFAIFQGERIFAGAERAKTGPIKKMIHDLLAVERFYSDAGGLIGYQLLVLNLLCDEEKESKELFIPPPFIDLRKPSRIVREAIIDGIKSQEQMAEFYPVGGAADRLNLKGAPAAHLLFLGRSLFEGMIADLEAREYLHWKLFGKKVETPIVIMTSEMEKHGAQIEKLCQDKDWFGRSPSSFYFLRQPLVPTFNRKAQWQLAAPLKLLLRPGGHGALWKLAHEAGIFEALEKNGCKKALIRQVNNPMAAIDYGLLAFLGVGHQRDSAFGFAACPRLLSASEGLNVVRKNKSKEVLTNLEYCHFEKCGFDKEEKSGAFPANTNLLFADLKSVQRASLALPYPGLLLNFRGEKENQVARLELTMQNIADQLGLFEEKGRCYLTLYERRKTLSALKRSFTFKSKYDQTPQACYYDYLLNVNELLHHFCQMELPLLPCRKDFLEKGPPFLFSAHPALGPLFSIIGQKLYGGRLASKSELHLDICDLECKNLELQGALLIHADGLMGREAGRCILRNVHVENQGGDWRSDEPFWTHQLERKEVCTIFLHRSSAFIAENVTLRGNYHICVEEGMQVTAREEEGRVFFTKEPLKEPLKKRSPFWSYSIDEASNIILN